MKKLLVLALALVMLLALCACGGGAKEEASAPEQGAAPAQEAAPAQAAAPAEAAAPAGDASGEMGASEESKGPVEKFDIVVNAPVIGEGAAEIFAVGGEYGKVDIDFTWTGPNGETITHASGTFGEGDYTVSLTFKAADGYELADPVSVKLVGGMGMDTDYQQIASSGVDGNGTPVYEMKDAATIAAGDGSSGEPSA